MGVQSVHTGTHMDVHTQNRKYANVGGWGKRKLTPTSLPEKPKIINGSHLSKLS